MSETAVAVPVVEAEPSFGEYVAAVASGMPPHVTLLYPFVPAPELDAGLEERAALVIAQASPFDVVFASTGRFEETLYLAPHPARRFVELTEALLGAFPNCVPYRGAYDAVVPHLTVAQGDRGVLDRLEPEISSRLPLRACVEAAVLFEQDQRGRWHERRRLPLGC